MRESHAKTETLMALRTEAARKEGVVETLLHEERQRADEARRQILEMETQVQSLHQELDQKNRRVQDMERCFAKHEEEVARLTSRVAELVAMEQALSTRATTITQRYTRNDLNDDEKTLVTTLMQKARALHDREIVEKNNEIKRRDNLIKQCEARILQLEQNLARRIHEVSRIVYTTCSRIHLSLATSAPYRGNCHCHPCSHPGRWQSTDRSRYAICPRFRRPTHTPKHKSHWWDSPLRYACPSSCIILETITEVSELL